MAMISVVRGLCSLQIVVSVFEIHVLTGVRAEGVIRFLVQLFLGKRRELDFGVESGQVGVHARPDVTIERTAHLARQVPLCAAGGGGPGNLGVEKRCEAVCLDRCVFHGNLRWLVDGEPRFEEPTLSPTPGARHWAGRQTSCKKSAYIERISMCSEAISPQICW